jgi:hypothetical protein
MITSYVLSLIPLLAGSLIPLDKLPTPVDLQVSRYRGP